MLLDGVEIELMLLNEKIEALYSTQCMDESFGCTYFICSGLVINQEGWWDAGGMDTCHHVGCRWGNLGNECHL